MRKEFKVKVCDTLLSVAARKPIAERLVSFSDLNIDDFELLKEGSRFRVVNA